MEFSELAKAIRSQSGLTQREFGQTFFSELFGMVEDKFGVIWQVLYYVGKKEMEE